MSCTYLSQNIKQLRLKVKNCAFMHVNKVIARGVMVSVVAIGPKVRGFNPGRGQQITKGDKIHRTLSLEGK
jgi:hypothetical protein